MLLRLSAILLGGLVIFAAAACSNGRSYTTTRADGDYDLAAMALTADEMPDGLTPALLTKHEYDNTDWVTTLRGAQILDSTVSADDQQKQLDDEGRVRSWVSVYQPAGLQRIIGVTTVSTLYKSAAQANTAMDKDLCGLPLASSQQRSPISVPILADASTGFQTLANGGLIDSTFCIRTGRIIHAIQETNVPGTEDYASLVLMGQNMVDRVGGVLDGKIKGTPVPTATPSATTTPIETAPASPTAAAPSTTPAPSSSTTPAAAPSAVTTPAPASATTSGG